MLDIGLKSVSEPSLSCHVSLRCFDIVAASVLVTNVGLFICLLADAIPLSHSVAAITTRLSFETHNSTLTLEVCLQVSFVAPTPNHKIVMRE